MPGPLKNVRHEKFAQELAKGRVQVEAYRLAGFQPHDSASARLFGDVRIRARVTELQERAAEKAVTTAADLAAQLDEDREFARNCQQAGAAVSASMGKAKVLGLLRDRIEHTGPDGGPILFAHLSDEEVEARLRTLLGDDGR